MNFLPGVSTTLFYLKLMDWSLKTHQVIILTIISTLLGIKMCKNYEILWRYKKIKKTKPDPRFSSLLGRSRRANKHLFLFLPYCVVCCNLSLTICSVFQLLKNYFSDVPRLSVSTIYEWQLVSPCFFLFISIFSPLYQKTLFEHEMKCHVCVYDSLWLALS